MNDRNDGAIWAKSRTTQYCSAQRLEPLKMVISMTGPSSRSRTNRVPWQSSETAEYETAAYVLRLPFRLVSASSEFLQVVGFDAESIQKNDPADVLAEWIRCKGAFVAIPFIQIRE